MRLVRFGGAMSLDGYIAGPNGEYDWIVMDPEIDFTRLMAPFDTFLIGRKTFDAMGRMGNSGKSTPGIENAVSRNASTAFLRSSSRGRSRRTIHASESNPTR